MRTEISDFLRESSVQKTISGALSTEDSPLDIAGIGLIDPIQYHLDIYKVDGDLEVDVKVEYAFDNQCDRCLKDVKEHVKSESHMIVTTKNEEEIEPNVLVVESLETFPLAELVFSQVITSVPTKILCKNDCMGLCPVCGEDLNAHPLHHCEMEGISPFESLKNLFDNSNEDREV